MSLHHDRHIRHEFIFKSPDDGHEQSFVLSDLDDTMITDINELKRGLLFGTDLKMVHDSIRYHETYEPRMKHITCRTVLESSSQGVKHQIARWEEVLSEVGGNVRHVSV